MSPPHQINSKILLTDGLWRKSLVATRALGKKGVSVTVTGDRPFTNTFFSKYCKKRLLTPSSKNNPKAFQKAILKELKKEKYDLLMVMEGDSLKALLPVRKEIESLTSFSFPNDQSLSIAFNKSKTILLAQKLNIPTPKTFHSLEQAADLKFPVLIKPVDSSGSRGIVEVNSQKELEKHYHLQKKEYKNLIIQEKIPQNGQEVGVNLLFDKNQKTIASFTYKRLRDYPVSGGPSTLRESTNNPQILKWSEKILKELGWYGVAMVEFKIDPQDNTPKLIEINPRFWGSLALPTASGVNFPYLLHKLSINKSIKPQTKYKVGIRARWFFPGDILHFLTNPKRLSLKPSFFNFFDKNTVYDNFDSSDMSGNFGVVLCTLINALNPKMWKLVFRKSKK